MKQISSMKFRIIYPSNTTNYTISSSCTNHKCRNIFSLELIETLVFSVRSLKNGMDLKKTFTLSGCYYGTSHKKLAN